MKVLVVVTLLLSIISLITGGAATRKTSCSPGESWKDSCHTCICDNDGRPLCTRELCKGQGIKMVLPPIRDKREAKECEPGTTWKEDCNTCFCTPNGHIGCTRRECFHPTRKYVGEDLSPPVPTTCGAPQGSVLGPLLFVVFTAPIVALKHPEAMVTAYADDIGVYASSKRLVFYQLVATAKMKVLVAISLLFSIISLITGCSPGEKWKESCNTCICNNDGSPVCTRELCKDQGVEMVLPVIREKREATECEPGTSWKEDCNTCVCTSNGQITCTRMKCFRVPPRNRYSTS
nr:uncharacterized protein LOC106685979 [Halyomorpha halys]